VPTLTAVDVLGIQRFVFASRRLRSVVGASWLVKQATEKGPDSALAELNAEDKAVLCAGGNLVLLFENRDEARRFAAEYSRWILDHTPGLEVVIEHRDFAPGEFAAALRRLFGDLDSAKAERSPSAPLLGLSVTAVCRETGLPASTTGRDGAPVSTMIANSDRDDVIENATTRWKELLRPDDHGEPRFPIDLEKLGATRGDTSMIGVVHIDGNGIGQVVTKWLDAVKGSDKEVRQQYQDLAKGINALGYAAMEAIVRRVQDGVDTDGDKLRFGAADTNDLRFDVHRIGGEFSLPLRPVLLGGDDLTFICDGRIALDLAATGLRALRKAAEESPIEGLRNVGACAGVAIVHSHSPFHRAVTQATKLCESAKVKARDSNAPLALDWHIGETRPGESIDDIRTRQYKNAAGGLTLRPYLVAGPLGWEWLERDLLGALRKDWAASRNKVKALPRLARDGPLEVMRNLEAWRVLEKKNLSLPSPIEANGFSASGNTPLLDAVELFDLHLACIASPEVSR
jgi:hypothetical protein